VQINGAEMVNQGSITLNAGKNLMQVSVADQSTGYALFG
jgi:hypothetical protein